MTNQLDKWKIEEWIRDYKFMLREIKRLDKILNKVTGGGQKLTATYGIESALPKGSGGISIVELNHIEARTIELNKYKEITKSLQTASRFLKNERHRVTYDCMLEGMSYREIAIHLGVSRNTVNKIKENILEIFVQKDHKSHFPRC